MALGHLEWAESLAAEEDRAFRLVEPWLKFGEFPPDIDCESPFTRNTIKLTYQMNLYIIT